MKLSWIACLLVAASFAFYAQPASPRITNLEPANGKKGDVITVTGENLDKGSVAKLYLTDGEAKNDIELSITSQTATEIKFSIPAKAAPGRLALMILTSSKPPQLIEQPWKLTIDEPTGQ
jgi:hypothetical protein